VTVTHRIALDPNNQQETLLRQHAGWARFAWNWGVAETRRALDAGEKSATSHYRLRPAFNRVKQYVAPWSTVLSQNAAKYALIDLRLDTMHKATTAIAKRSRLVCIESLHVAGWLRNRRLSRATVDASPARFLSLLRWKCQREGVRLVETGPFYPSSKTCSACGAVNADLRLDETWRCPACGAMHHRDDNAALNLRRQGLAADVESVSDGRVVAVLDEASTRQIIPHLCR